QVDRVGSDRQGGSVRAGARVEPRDLARTMRGYPDGVAHHRHALGIRTSLSGPRDTLPLRVNPRDRAIQAVRDEDPAGTDRERVRPAADGNRRLRRVAGRVDWG